MFQIHAGSGALSTAQPLDREARSRYSLEVVAVDTGIPALSTTVTVEVNVMDLNDNSPAFGRASYAVDVSEDAPEGAVVLQVTAAGGTSNTDAGGES